MVNTYTKTTIGQLPNKKRTGIRNDQYGKTFVEIYSQSVHAERLANAEWQWVDEWGTG